MESELGQPEPHGRKARAQPMNIEEILIRYTGGYTPYYHPPADSLFWDLKKVRALIPLTSETAERAGRLLRTIRPPYGMRQNEAVETVLACLSDERVKPRTWVRGPVLTLYRILEEHGFLRTIEAMDNGRVAGAVLAIDLPGVLIIESMFCLAPNSSKQCVCQAVQDYYQRGYAFIDVENQHHALHPLARLGEKVFPMAEYLRLLRETVRRFAGSGGTERPEQVSLCLASFN
jgi:leucyl/phenylalanyl-tRNA--protein transferase